jgi:hypothetical protein
MKTMTHAQETVAERPANPNFAVDTTFVLFFLAFDCGQRFAFGIDGLLSAVTLIMFVILPYFLPFDGEKPAFEQWVLGRSAIACLAIVLGLMFRQSIGIFLPEMFRFAPLTLLIVAGFVSFYVQLYSLFKLRPVK